VGDCIRDIESHCRWFDTDRLTREVEALETTIKEVQTIVKQDLQKMREAGVMAERRDEFEENEDFGDEEDILDLRMPKDSGANRGTGAKQTGKKRNRGRRGRDKTRFRQS